MFMSYSYNIYEYNINNIINKLFIKNLGTSGLDVFAPLHHTIGKTGHLGDDQVGKQGKFGDFFSPF